MKVPLYDTVHKLLPNIFYWHLITKKHSSMFIGIARYDLVISVILTCLAKRARHEFVQFEIRPFRFQYQPYF